MASKKEVRDINPKTFLYNKPKTYIIIILIAITSVILAKNCIDYYNSNITSGKLYAQEIVRSHTLEIAKTFNDLNIILTVFVTGVEEMRLAGHTSRETIIKQQKAILEKHPQFLGINICYEPNAYDGQDVEYEGHPVYLDKGIFMSCVRRGEDGFIVESLDNEAIGADWYIKAKKSNSAVLSPPTTYKIGEKTANVVSLIMPIKNKDGVVIGAASLDYLLEMLNIRGVQGTALSGYDFIFDGKQIVKSSYPILTPGMNIETISKLSPKIAKVIFEASQGHFSSVELTGGSLDEFLLVAGGITLAENGDNSNWVYARVMPKSYVLANFYNSMILCLIAIGFIFGLMAIVLFLTFIPKRDLSDELTGIYNRKFINTYLPKYIGKAVKKNQNLSLVMCDLDDFKLVNDNFGHLVGDIVIKEFAKTINKTIYNNNDWAARYGGEEFLICLPNATLEVAEKVVERLLDNVRASVVKTRISGQELELKYTVSCGIASLAEPPGENAVSMEELIGVADNNLYEAKRTGKDKYVS